MALTPSPEPEDTVGAWSERVKLEILRRYLPAYTAVMAEQRGWCTGGFHYVDAFAGTGSPRARGEERLVDGSPRIALGLDRPFDTYTFIEREGWRAERLRALVAGYPDRRARVVEGDCNEVILRDVAPGIRYEDRARGFAFLDPFAANLRFETLAAIAETRAIEVVLNLPTMAMNRTGLPGRPGALTAAQVARMDAVWGDGSWFDEFYRRDPDLFGSAPIVKAGKTGAARIAQAFKKERLESIFAQVSDPLVVRNDTGQPIYCLFFAGHNATGAKIARQVFGRARWPDWVSARPQPATLPLFG